MSEIRQRALELALEKNARGADESYRTAEMVVETAKIFENYLRYGDDLRE